MTATEVLREEVRQYIDHADDKTLRKMKDAIVEIEQEGEDAEEGEDWWDELPTNIQALVETGLKESERGGGIPHKEMVKKYPKWLKK